MKPAPFRYRDPRTLDEALELLAEHRETATVLAGGQSLIPLMNQRSVRPELVLDVNRVPGLDGVEALPGVMRLGALVRASRVERSPDVVAVLPVLPEALTWVSHPQVRNRTTIGGNVAHADPASEVPGVLAATGGSLTLTSVSGERTVDWSDFVTGAYTTARRPDELVTAVNFPVPPGMAFAFDEAARRRGDFALVATCVGLRRSGDIVDEARIALVGVADRPQRAAAAERVLAGRLLDDEALGEATELVHDAINPPPDERVPAAYRRQVGATLVCRSLRKLWGST
jgi:aerobic carbon-monoxide dehydrogenase medium subunit